MEIVFVRHALTEPNIKNLPYDNYTENEYYPITKEGEKQAQTTGKYYKDLGYGEFDLVISSPRHRCIQTAENILKTCQPKKQIKIETDKRLLEGPVGIFNMMETNAKRAIRNSNEFKEYFQKRNDLFTKIDNTTNDFELYKLNRELFDMDNDKKWNKKLGYWSRKYKYSQFNSFLNSLKKRNAKRVLVVGHGYTVFGMYKAINPTFDDILIDNLLIDKSVWINGNCQTFSCVYDRGQYVTITPIHTKFLNSKIETK